jgi:glycerol-3-phosphate dehydrogenase
MRRNSREGIDITIIGKLFTHMTRSEMLTRLEQQRSPWDFIVIGGGATGAGVAVDAASRGFRVLLLEQSDFGKGTSSRSTKLVHGGVRYLEQGNISLVMEALKERGILRQNAPHLVGNLPFVVPNYDWWETPFYGLGLKLYNLLAGKYGFGDSTILSREETLGRLPTIRTDGLRGGVVYYDGQFDDSRLLINLLQTAAAHGAAVLNYVRVTGLTKAGDGTVDGIIARDTESNSEFHARARVVVNAAGPFVDAVRRLADADVRPLIAPSQGIHLVFDRSFLPGESAIMVPHTKDGRVMFAIPWHAHTVVGTTDTPIAEVLPEPRAQQDEIGFILETAALYLHKAPSRDDVLSVFAGIRPLVRTADNFVTAALSRSHSVHIDPSGLLTTTGGKWTTYRHMAEDTVNQASELARLPERPCVTTTLKIHGFHEGGDPGPLSVYGADASAVRELERHDPALAAPLDTALPYTAAQVVWGVREEMARTVEDVLARRCRALFLNARAAVRMAPRVAALLARELGRDAAWERHQIAEFEMLARGYMV